VKGFFARMNFPRAVILVCTLGSLALGVLVYMRTRRLHEVERELRQVPDVVREIQTAAMKLNDLQRQAGAEKWKAQSEPEFYIRSIAVNERINMGQVEILSRKDFPMKGVEDNIYTIRPASKSQHHQRLQIGNFLYTLEKDSRRVKVTSIKLTPPPNAKLSPGEIGDDMWVFQAELTTRTKLEPTTPAGGQEG
jgi:hypothetical protein